MFELSKSQKEIQKAAREFAKGEFDKELAYEFERDSIFPEKIWKKAADLGFIGIHYPDQFSGGGMGLLDFCLIIEELCKKDPSLGAAIVESANAGECILRFGSEEIKEKYLPEIAEGKILCTGAFTESARGEDYSSLKTLAKKKGNSWIINGSKSHVVNGDKANVIITLCKTEDSAEGSVSMYILESDDHGLKASRNNRLLGGNMISTATVELDNVEIPETRLLGKQGKGLIQLEKYLDDRKIILASMALGNALASFDRVLEYVKGRVQFGRKIASFQVSQHKIADMATKIELARLVIHKAASLRDKNKADSSLCAIAKMTASRAAMEIGAQTIQLFGGYGYMTEYEVERFYREAKMLEIRDGARDIQKDIIAKSAIGKIK